ncbi:MAG TPA: zinc-binding dehydrogenase [Dissulfurispiraceae bacterium]|nr:zinc-binding dehydrogenase [Dissulfurispiraceae bacterium]
MRVAHLIRPGAIELCDLSEPQPGPGEVLLKVEAALTCGTDVKAFVRGHSLIPMPGPFGHEFSGVIAKRGTGVRRFKEGDAVMSTHSAPCLACRYCKKKLHNLCERIMATKVLGAFGEYLIVPSHVVQQNMYLKPSKLSFAEAAMLEPLSCVVHGQSGLEIRSDDVLLIIGTGPIGLLHMLLAKKRGARVIISGLEPERLALARRLGADLVVEAAAGLSLAVEEFTGGIGADIVVECTGQLDVWETSVNYVRRGGTVVLFGGCKSGCIVTYDTHRLHYDELTLKGIFHFTPRDVKEAFGLLRNGFDVKALITETCPLSGISEVFARLSRGIGIKYALIP